MSVCYAFMFELYFWVVKNFKAIFDAHIWRLSPRWTAKLHFIILKFDKVIPYYARSPRKFSIFTTRLPQDTNFWYLSTNKGLKCTNSWDIRSTATEQLEVCNKIFFEKVYIWCSKCLPPAKAHAFWQYSKSLRQLLLALVWSSALS